MYSHASKEEENEFKLRKEAIRKYWILNCFSFDYKLDKFDEGEEIFDNDYFLEKSRLYKKDDKYYSLTYLFLSLVKKQKKEGIEKIYIEPIIDLIIAMNKDKIISTRANYIKKDNYQDILIDYIDRNDIQKYNISSISAEELKNIISTDDYLLPLIIQHKGTNIYYKQAKKEDFINKFLEHYKV